MQASDIEKNESRPPLLSHPRSAYPLLDRRPGTASSNGKEMFDFEDIRFRVNAIGAWARIIEPYVAVNPDRFYEESRLIRNRS